MRLTLPTRRTILQLMLAAVMARVVRAGRRPEPDARLVEIDGWILRRDDLS
ncbi:MAG: hypothetical protein WAT70_05540 [Rhizobiaceae bacterium]